MSRKDQIRDAYKTTGGQASFYDGMMTYSTFLGKLVCRLVWNMDGEKNLSAQFKVKEFACQDGSDPVFVSDALVAVLQKIRTHFGVPVDVNSGFRSAGHNKKVGGAAYSRHLYGTAADIAVRGVAPEKVYAYAETLLPASGGIGLYSWGIHVDVRPEKGRWRG